jgi:hypothetical protein
VAGCDADGTADADDDRNDDDDESTCRLALMASR